MSLQLHLSSRSDELLAKLRPRLSAARSACLQGSSGIPRPIPVLVPSAQIGDWLQVRLARDLGLSMGFEFLQPRVYFGRHFATGVEAVAFAKGYAFWTPERLRWRILPAVEEIAKNLGHDQSKSLGPRDRFAFAQLLAQQFDRYAHFRPDWPGRWDENQTAWGPGSRDLPLAAPPDEAWQRQLWQTLAILDGVSPHPAQLLSGLARATSEATEAAAPLFVVGTDLIDPLFLRTLDALSRRGHAISVFLLLPSLGYLRERLRGLAEEQFRVLYLNRRNVLLENALIAQGSVDAVRPSLRNIVVRALQVNASAMIASHNHPSGAAEPSESDRMLTQDLIAASRPLGLKVLDHVVVGEETTFSFADSGLLDELELLCLAPGESGRHSKLSKTTD